MSQKMKNTILCSVSFLSGMCNAVLGAGGGILLSLTIPKLLCDRFSDRRDVYVNSQAAMIPGCILSCIIYAASGTLDTANFSIYAIPAVIGGALGSLLLTKINSKWISKIFAALVIWSGGRMIMR